MIFVRPRAVQFSLLLLLISTTALAQKTISVPADQPTIQAAISVANSGDTVLVAPGTYVENINFLGKAITVTSSGGAASTIIDGGGNATVVTFNSGESLSSVLNGFTLRNGYGSGTGGGIEIKGTSPTISNNTITGNRATEGCGIEVYSGSPLIQGNTITANSQVGSGGTGGGGIDVVGSNTQFANPKILNNIITNNNLGSQGGGISVGYFASPLIQNNFVAGNSAYGGGGGISITSYQSPLVLQNIVVNNTSTSGGGGIRVSVSSGAQPQLINNTLYGNSAADGTSGLYIDAGQGSILSNNIIEVASGNAITCGNTYNPIPGTISYNLAYSAAGQSWAGSCSANAGVSGNLAVDPLFADALNDDFHLKTGSPAIDVGDITIPSLPAQDYSGAARLADDSGQCAFSVDLGVYESHSAAAGSLSISPLSLAFADTAVGNVSAPLSLILTGTGQGCFRITGFTVTGDFAQSNSCGTGVPAGQSCTVQVSFAPTAAGMRTGTLSVPINTNAGAPPTPVALSGNGLVPHGTASPSSLSFPGQNVNTTSTPQTIIVTNDGGAALTVSSIVVTGEFAQTNSCNAPVPPGASCTIQITFTPSANGTRYGRLSIASNSSPAMPNVSLTGLGLGPQGAFSPLGLHFYQQFVHTTSPVQNVSLTNVGALPMHITSFDMAPGYGGDFTETNNCPATLGPNSSCIIQVTFTPTTSGWRQDLFSVSSDAPPFGPLTMDGYGATNVAQWVTSPSSVNFGDVVVTQTGTQNVVLTNNGDTPLTISSLVTSSSFSATGCAGSINPGSSCSIVVSWTPAAAGVQNGTLTINSNAVNYIQSLSLTGRAVQPVLTYLPGKLTFASQSLGTSSTSQAITLSNSGNGAYTLSQMVISGPDFSPTNNCPAIIVPGASCTINVIFNPTTTGSLSATLSATGSPAGVGGSVVLSGTGIPPAPVASLGPSSLTFSTQRTGTTSPPQLLTLSNTGSSTLTISSIAANGAIAFAQTNNCPATLSPGNSCSINVTFAPIQSGTFYGNVIVTDDSNGTSGSTQEVFLTGTGGASTVALSPGSLTFGTTKVASSSAASAVTIANNGTMTLSIGSISTSGDFSQSNNCGSSIAPGASCTVNVVFTPVAVGSRTGGLTITSDAQNGNVLTVPLSGTGGGSLATVSPSSLTFGITKVGTSSASRTLSISNGGTTALNISSLSISGDFSQSNNCGSSVAAGGSCIVNIIFVPTATGSRSGTLTVSDDAQNGTVQTVSLSGTGAVPIASVSPASLTFATTAVGTTSSSSGVTFSNTGAVAMNIASIATSGDFLQSNNCSTLLAANSSCTINVSFAPTASGTRSGVLTITDDAAGGSQTVSLAGSATDFSVVVSPTSVSINPGQNASYTVKVSAVGGAYNQTVSLSCSGLPAGATCTLTPISLNPGSTSQTSKVKITTSNGGTPAGTYTIVVTGTVNNAVRYGSGTLIVK